MTKKEPMSKLFLQKNENVCVCNDDDDVLCMYVGHYFLYLLTTTSTSTNLLTSTKEYSLLVLFILLSIPKIYNP